MGLRIHTFNAPDYQISRTDYFQTHGSKIKRIECCCVVDVPSVLHGAFWVFVLIRAILVPS